MSEKFTLKEGTTAEMARTKLESIEDDETHPYHNPQDPLHREALDLYDALMARATGGDKETHTDEGGEVEAEGVEGEGITFETVTDTLYFDVMTPQEARMHIQRIKSDLDQPYHYPESEFYAKAQQQMKQLEKIAGQSQKSATTQTKVKSREELRAMMADSKYNPDSADYDPAYRAEVDEAYKTAYPDQVSVGLRDRGDTPVGSMAEFQVTEGYEEGSKALKQEWGSEFGERLADAQKFTADLIDIDPAIRAELSDPAVANNPDVVKLFSAIRRGEDFDDLMIKAARSVKGDDSLLREGLRLLQQDPRYETDETFRSWVESLYRKAWPGGQGKIGPGMGGTGLH